MPILKLFSVAAERALLLSYAEALFIKYPAKGNRNETEGKVFIGTKGQYYFQWEQDGRILRHLLSEPIAYIRSKSKHESDPLIIDDFLELLRVILFS